MHPVPILIIGLGAATIGFVITWSVLLVRLLRTLRREHVEVFESLGSPSFLLMSLPSQVRLLRLITKREIQGDPKVAHLCGLMHRILAAFVVTVGAAPWVIASVAWWWR